MRYSLPYRSLPRRASRNGQFMNELLREAAQMQPESEPLVVAIDALDEVDTTGLPPGANVLYLPPVLPAGVYFVVTTKPVEHLRLQVSRLQILSLFSG